MSMNIKQIYDVAPTSSMQSTDLFYLGRAPYDVASDYAITWGNTLTSIATQASGTWSISISGTAAIATTVTNTLDNTSSSSMFLGFVPSSASGNQGIRTSASLNYNPSTSTLSTGTLNASVFTGGNWQGGMVLGTYGGTGVNNGSHTITIGGNVTYSGAFTFTGTVTANTSVTFPTSGTLAVNNIVTVTASASLSPNTTYIVNNSSPITLTLPSSPTVGDLYRLVMIGNAQYTVAYNSGQSIRIGGSVSTTTSGNIQSYSNFSCIDIIYAGVNSFVGLPTTGNFILN